MSAVSRSTLIGPRIDRATATIPQTATQAIFTVSGGRVIITSLIGEVTVALGATATTMSVGLAPTTGTAATAGLSAATSIASKEIGTLIAVNQVAGGALWVSTNAGSPPQVGAFAGYFAPAGTVTITTSANNTGSMKWSLTYNAYDAGATVVAA